MTNVKFSLFSISDYWKFSLLNHTSINKNSELNVFRKTICCWQFLTPAQIIQVV